MKTIIAILCFCASCFASDLSRIQCANTNCNTIFVGVPDLVQSVAVTNGVTVELPKAIPPVVGKDGKIITPGVPAAHTMAAPPKADTANAVNKITITTTKSFVCPVCSLTNNFSEVRVRQTMIHDLSPVVLVQ